MTVKWRIRCFLAFALTLLSADSFAAEFVCDFPARVAERPDSCRYLLLKGAILPGDGERFAKILRQSHPFLDMVSLWSPGGSVEDAMKIGRLIRKGLIETQAPSSFNSSYIDPATGSLKERPGWGELTSVRNASDCKGYNCHCASACFLIWAAGVKRIGEVLGLHRPTIEATAFAKLPPDRAGVLYRQLLSDIGRYLDEMEIPRRFIEIMTNTSSKDVRWLSPREAQPSPKEDNRPPSIAEWLASSCGAMTKSEKDMFDPWHVYRPSPYNQQGWKLQDQLTTKRRQIDDCETKKIQLARDGIKEVSD
jgi:hypothetical protein